MCFALPEAEQERPRIEHISSPEYETKVMHRYELKQFLYFKFWEKAKTSVRFLFLGGFVTMWHTRWPSTG
jgi:hypothetical protein